MPFTPLRTFKQSALEESANMRWSRPSVMLSFLRKAARQGLSSIKRTPIEEETAGVVNQAPATYHWQE